MSSLTVDAGTTSVRNWPHTIRGRMHCCVPGVNTACVRSTVWHDAHSIHFQRCGPRAKSTCEYLLHTLFAVTRSALLICGLRLPSLPWPALASQRPWAGHNEFPDSSNFKSLKQVYNFGPSSQWQHHLCWWSKHRQAALTCECHRHTCCGLAT